MVQILHDLSHSCASEDPRSVSLERPSGHAGLFLLGPRLSSVHCGDEYIKIWGCRRQHLCRETDAGFFAATVAVVVALAAAAAEEVAAAVVGNSSSSRHKGRARGRGRGSGSDSGSGRGSGSGSCNSSRS